MSNIVAKIDVTKIDKSKLFKGTKGTYLDVILIATSEDKYGNDFMVCQSVSQEDRRAGVKGAILGNAKYLGGAPRTQQAQTPPPQRQREPQPQSNNNGFEEGDCPF